MFYCFYHSWYFCACYFKKGEIKQEKKIDKIFWEKRDFIREWWNPGVQLLNFEGSPGVPLLNSEGGPRVPLLNFRGSQVSLLNFE